MWRGKSTGGRLFRGSMLSKDLGDLGVSPPLGPCQRGGPWRVIGETCGCAAGEQELDHIRHVGAGCPRQRCRTVLLLSGGNRRAGFQQDLRTRERLSWLA